MIEKIARHFRFPSTQDSAVLCKYNEQSITAIFGAVIALSPHCHCQIITVLVGIYASGEQARLGGGDTE